MLTSKNQHLKQFSFGASVTSELATTNTNFNASQSGINEQKVTLEGTGSTVITASHEGNVTYNAGPSITKVFIVMINTANINFIKKSTVLIYSKPASNEIHIEFNKKHSSKTPEVSKFNLNGQFITKKTIDLNNGGMNYIIDVSNIISGIYIIEFIIEEESTSRKIVMG